MTRADLDFTPKGTSFVDINLAGDQIVVSSWLYLAIPFCSDHPYIYFKVEFAGMAPLLKNLAVRKAPALNCFNQNTFLTNLARPLSNLKPYPASLSPPVSTELHIVNLSAALVSCAISTKVKVCDG